MRGQWLLPWGASHGEQAVDAGGWEGQLWQALVGSHQLGCGWLGWLGTCCRVRELLLANSALMLPDSSLQLIWLLRDFFLLGRF